jgi:general secretion pathway protein G
MALPPGNDAKKDSRRRRWLTPLDVVVVVVVFLLILGGYILTHTLSTNSFARTRSAIAQIGAFREALDMFKADRGFYPAGTNGLMDLAVKPTNASTTWRPCMVFIPLDPWGHPYLYVFPGKHNTNSYDLSSAGPDGIPGTPDDIANWK